MHKEDIMQRGHCTYHLWQRYAHWEYGRYVCKKIQSLVFSVDYESKICTSQLLEPWTQTCHQRSLLWCAQYCPREKSPAK